MSNKTFFTELIMLEEFEKQLRQGNLAEEEVVSLLNDLSEILHTQALNMILEELPEEHHEEFLIVFSENPADAAHWDFLRSKVPGFRERLTNRLFKFKQDLLKEIQ